MIIYSQGSLSDLTGHVGHPETKYPGIHGYEFLHLLKILIGWNNEGLVTVGFIPTLLFIVSIVFAFRRNLIWLIALVIFTILALGANGPIDPYQYLWHLPFFNAITNPQKYFSPEILFIVLVISGSSFNLLRKLNNRWAEPVLAILLILLSTSFLYPKMFSIQENTYSDPPLSERKLDKTAGGFYQVQGLNLRRNRVSPLESIAYFNVRRNVGTIDWYTALLSAEHTIPRYWIDKDGQALFHSRYRGEIFLLDDIGEPNEYRVNEERSPDIPFKVTFAPNEINANFTIDKPGIVVINQNFHEDWRTNSGSLFNKGGLLAVRYTKSGVYDLELRFTSYSFFRGLITSAFGVFVISIVSWLYISGRLNKTITKKSVVTRQVGRLLLKIIS